MKIDVSAWKVKWKICSVHGGKYLPSKTSHEHMCGICAPLKNPKALKWTKFTWDVGPDGEPDNEI